MQKTFVLDTNVILIDPFAINKFGKNKVVIPLVVIEEVDRFKKDQNENGRNARHFSRLIDDLRSKGPLVNGVALDNGGTIFLAVDIRAEIKSDVAMDLSIIDNVILGSAIKRREAGESVTLITKDINLRLKADVLGIPAEDYGQKNLDVDELYTGYRHHQCADELISRFESEKKLAIEDLGLEDVIPNEYFVLELTDNPRRRALGRYDKHQNMIVPLISKREGVWGIHPKNIEQQFALDALLNEDIKLVSLVGKAGTGKTLLAIAAGLEMSIGQEKYSRLLVSRPIQPMGKDLGYLPGDVNEKLGPWMQPIFDNMDFLFGQHREEGTASYDDLINHGLLHIEPLTYIRGRSIPGQYLIVDEAQNLSPHEVKTIITRAGEGTKIVLTGDCHQIDSPYLDEVNNGLVYCLENMKSEPIVGHSLLTQGERSALSEAASKLL